MESIIFAELVAKRDDLYTLFVFKNLDTSEFLMCTKLPNWQTPHINIGDIGYVSYKSVKAGDEYCFPTGEKDIYKYDNTYFTNFVLKTETKEILW